MRLSLFIIFGSVLFLPDLYFFLAYTRKRRWYFTFLLCLPTLIALVSAFWWMAGTDSTLPPKILFSVMVCCSLPKAVGAIVSLLAKGVGLLSKKAAKIMGYMAVAATVLAFFVAVFGCTIGCTHLTVTEQEIVSEDLPDSFDGYRIVQLSDLHVGTFSERSSFVSGLVEEICGLFPDMIVFTGDLVNIRYSELAPFRNDLSRLRFSQHDGIFSVLGNHDYGGYGHYREPDGKQRNLDSLRAWQRAMGWDLLEDEHRIIRRGNDSIAIIGVGDIGVPPFPHQGDLQKALRGLDVRTFKILLSHDPSHWRWEVVPQSNVQLTLSGHTHAMQFRLGRFSPVKWLYPEWGGLYEEGNQNLFVSTGLGGTIPFRLGVYPEIVIITLKKK